jgi:hypothetical protein
VVEWTAACPTQPRWNRLAVRRALIAFTFGAAAHQRVRDCFQRPSQTAKDLPPRRCA